VEVTNTMGAGELVRKYLESEAGSELLGEMVKMAAELLMDAEVDVLCGAGYGERSEARVNSRNGHRRRRWDTRAGTVTLDVPKLRRGSYFPSLLEPRRRAEQALVSVVCQAYVEGVSTRRVDDLVRSNGDREDVEVPGLRAREGPRPTSCRVPSRPLAGGHHSGVLVALSSRFSRRRAGIDVLGSAVSSVIDDHLQDRLVYLERPPASGG